MNSQEKQEIIAKYDELYAIVRDHEKRGSIEAQYLAEHLYGGIRPTMLKFDADILKERRNDFQRSL